MIASHTTFFTDSSVGDTLRFLMARRHCSVTRWHAWCRALCGYLPDKRKTSPVDCLLRLICVRGFEVFGPFVSQSLSLFSSIN
ncbi:hypothetical protein ECSE_P3-0022 (plasmid) [Escherichia coli SE11]|uniref:Uncharacterized protein n=1 Tax=Escherichia coli (strain SE11) TaxID=409438 RepID=A0A979GK35_ECOSE|nr:hypothetical protein ECSE_P3-0022 [Escherichia coli SE11]